MSTLKPRTLTVTLWQGDDLTRIEEYEEQFNSAAPRDLMRIGDSSDMRAAAEAHDRFVTEAKDRAVQVVVRSLPRKKWRALILEHPPRSGDEKDDAAGFNRETLAEDLVPASILSATSADPDFCPDMANSDGRDEFLDSLSDGDFSSLYSASVLLNRGERRDPKADLSLRLTQISEQRSKLQDRLG